MLLKLKKKNQKMFYSCRTKIKSNIRSRPLINGEINRTYKIQVEFVLGLCADFPEIRNSHYSAFAEIRNSHYSA